MWSSTKGSIYKLSVRCITRYWSVCGKGFNSLHITFIYSRLQSCLRYERDERKKTPNNAMINHSNRCFLFLYRSLCGSFWLFFVIHTNKCFVHLWLNAIWGSQNSSILLQFSFKTRQLLVFIYRIINRKKKTRLFPHSYFFSFYLRFECSSCDDVTLSGIHKKRFVF